ncbi:ABC transporter ATP-binding protein [Micrococcus sp. IITD107]|uniref:ABC transporter ATP-binding protein n=1 Tax=Micrococcus sp. IITD107 TaxID=3342790 RepID=UPI0035B6BEA4
MSTAEPILTAQDVTCVFYTNLTRGRRSVVACREVSFALHAGDCLAIVGESGSGKTTLVRIATGLEQATSGSVTVGDVTVTGRMTRRLRKMLSSRIQMVFQDPRSSFNRRLKVWQSVAEVMAAHGIGDRGTRRQAVERLFAEVGLGDRHLDALPDQLSGGQLQRVAIARALAAEPDIIVLDEAVSALDVTVQAQILDLLARLKTEKKLAYLFITHDLAVANEIADEVMVMKAGEVVERGQTRELLTAPRDEYTRQLIASIPRPGWSPARRLPNQTKELAGGSNG